MATLNDGITTSTGNTPQAGDDTFTSATTGITEDSTGTFTLDVMANDLGGKAKSLYSLDNGAEIGDASAYSDLLAKDAVGSVQYSALGAEIKITADGKVTYHMTSGMNLNSLAQGESVTDTFTYAIKLGNGTLSWATASVQILGTNDAPTVTALTSSINEGAGTVTVDALTGAADVDHGAVLSVVAPSELPAGVSYDADTHSFSLDASHGAYDHLAAGATEDVVVTYGVSDEHGAVTQNTVTFTVTGTNDAPTVEAALTASVDEGSSASVNGLTGAADLDDGASLSVVSPGTLPAGVTVSGDTISLDASNAAYDHLAAGVTETVTVNYGVTDGIATTDNTVTFTVTGVNDAAAIGGVATGSVTEDAAATLAASGDLTIADADDGQSAFAAQTVAGAYGSFTLDAGGHWTYEADNSAAAIQGLNDGQSLTDSFTAHSIDGSADQVVTVTIHGVNEPVVVPVTDPNDFDNLVTATGGGTINGGNTGTTIYGTTGDDVINAQSGNDIVYGGAGNDDLKGQNDNDTLYGGSGNDTINGGNNSDVIYGGSGDDRITGANAADTLYGGTGADTFVFGATADSTVAASDTIRDFQHGVDKIDLSAIDASSALSGDQAFAFAGNNANTVANSITWSESGGNTVIHIDVNGDTTADMQIVLTGTGLNLTASDIVL